MVPALAIGGFLSALVCLPFAWPFQASWPDMGWLAALGVGQLAIPCVLAMLCARVLPAAEVALLGLLEVVFGITLVWALAGEAPRPEVLQGGALVLGAMLLSEGLAWLGRAAGARHTGQAAP